VSTLPYYVWYALVLSIVLSPVHYPMLRSHDIFFLPIPLFSSIFPSIINCRNWYLSLSITWPRYAVFRRLMVSNSSRSLLIILKTSSLVLLAVHGILGTRLYPPPFLECFQLVHSAHLQYPSFHAIKQHCRDIAFDKSNFQAKIEIGIGEHFFEFRASDFCV